MLYVYNIWQGADNPERAQMRNLGMRPFHEESMLNSWHGHVNFEGSMMNNTSQRPTKYDVGQGPDGHSCMMSNIRQGSIHQGAANVLQGPSIEGCGMFNRSQGQGNPERASNLCSRPMEPMYQGSMKNNLQGPAHYEGSTMNNNTFEEPGNQRNLSNVNQGAIMSNLAEGINHIMPCQTSSKGLMREDFTCQTSFTRIRSSQTYVRGLRTRNL